MLSKVNWIGDEEPGGVYERRAAVQILYEPAPEYLEGTKGVFLMWNVVSKAYS